MALDSVGTGICLLLLLYSKLIYPIVLAVCTAQLHLGLSSLRYAIPFQDTNYGAFGRLLNAVEKMYVHIKSRLTR